MNAEVEYTALVSVKSISKPARLPRLTSTLCGTRTRRHLRSASVSRVRRTNPMRYSTARSSSSMRPLPSSSAGGLPHPRNVRSYLFSLSAWRAPPRAPPSLRRPPSGRAAPRGFSRPCGSRRPVSLGFGPAHHATNVGSRCVSAVARAHAAEIRPWPAPASGRAASSPEPGRSRDASPPPYLPRHGRSARHVRSASCASPGYRRSATRASLRECRKT